jgi:hypothetical protein
MRWLVNVGCVGERRNVYRGNMEIRYHLEDLDDDRRIILKWIPIIKPTRCTDF